MFAVRKLSLYIDRSSRQWIVLDTEGNYWTLPSDENAWDRRQPYQVDEASKLEPIPGHYKYALGLTD